MFDYLLLNYLIKTFIFYNRPITFAQNEEYQFKLNRLLQKIQHFTKNNPDGAINLYLGINDIYNKEILDYQAAKPSSPQQPEIKNPLVIKTRGRPPQKRMKSVLEKGKKKSLRTE